MKTLMRITVLLMVTFGSSVSADTTIIDGFSSTNSWGTLLNAPGMNMIIENGQMNYISTTTDNGVAVLSRNAPLLPISQSWSLKVDAHIDPFSLTTHGQFVDVLLGFGKTGDCFNNHISFEFCRGWFSGSNTDYDIGDDIFIDGEDAPELFYVYDLSSPDVALRMDYNASNYTVTFYFDSDGAGNGYNWAPQGSANLMSGTYDMNLDPTNTFTILLLGSSEHQTVTSGQAYLDNLEVTLSIPDPIIKDMSIVSNDFHFSISSELGFPVVIERSANLMDWMSVETNSAEDFSFLFNAPISSNSSQQFYRGKLLLQ